MRANMAPRKADNTPETSPRKSKTLRAADKRFREKILELNNIKWIQGVFEDQQYPEYLEKLEQDFVNVRPFVQPTSPKKRSDRLITLAKGLLDAVVDVIRTEGLKEKHWEEMFHTWTDKIVQHVFDKYGSGGFSSITGKTRAEHNIKTIAIRQLYFSNENLCLPAEITPVKGTKPDIVYGIDFNSLKGKLRPQDWKRYKKAFQPFVESVQKKSEIVFPHIIFEAKKSSGSKEEGENQLLKSMLQSLNTILLALKHNFAKRSEDPARTVFGILTHAQDWELYILHITRADGLDISRQSTGLSLDMNDNPNHCIYNLKRYTRYFRRLAHGKLCQSIDSESTSSIDDAVHFIRVIETLHRFIHYQHIPAIKELIVEKLREDGVQVLESAVTEKSMDSLIPHPKYFGQSKQLSQSSMLKYGSETFSSIEMVEQIALHSLDDDDDDDDDDDVDNDDDDKDDKDYDEGREKGKDMTEITEKNNDNEIGRKNRGKDGEKEELKVRMVSITNDNSDLVDKPHSETEEKSYNQIQPLSESENGTSSPSKRQYGTSNSSDHESQYSYNSEISLEDETAQTDDINQALGKLNLDNNISLEGDTNCLDCEVGYRMCPHSGPRLNPEIQFGSPDIANSEKKASLVDTEVVDDPKAFSGNTAAIIGHHENLFATVEDTIESTSDRSSRMSICEHDLDPSTTRTTPLKLNTHLPRFEPERPSLYQISSTSNVLPWEAATHPDLVYRSESSGEYVSFPCLSIEQSSMRKSETVLLLEILDSFRPWDGIAPHVQDLVRISLLTAITVYDDRNPLFASAHDGSEAVERIVSKFTRHRQAEDNIELYLVCWKADTMLKWQKKTLEETHRYQALSTVNFHTIGDRYCDVTWYPSWEPKENLPISLITHYEGTVSSNPLFMMQFE